MAKYKKELRGYCTRCKREVACIGDQFSKDDVPVFSKDKVVEVGFYCSVCKKIFCGGCAIPEILRHEPGTQISLPECPVCHKRAEYAKPSDR